MKKKILLIPLVLLLAISLVATGCPAPPPAPPPVAPPPVAPPPAPPVAPPPAPPPPAPPEIVKVPQWGSPMGTGGYGMVMGMEDLARKNHPWLRLPAAECPGWIYNIKAHDANPALWENTVIGFSHMALFLAEKKMGPFDEKIVGYKRLVLASTQGSWLVSLNPNITTTEDLIGKKIALGYKTQVNWCWGVDMLIRDGLGIGDKVDIVYAGTKPALHALLDGITDVAICGGYPSPITKDFAPSPVLIELEASGRTLYHIGFSEEDFAAVKAKTGLSLGQLLLPAGTAAGMTKDIRAFAALNCYGVRDIFLEDLAYEVTKCWIDNCDKLGEYHALGKLVTREGLAFAATKKNTHPGAVRAFEEAGITIPEK